MCEHWASIAKVGTSMAKDLAKVDADATKVEMSTMAKVNMAELVVMATAKVTEAAAKVKMSAMAEVIWGRW